jgi:murein DD-endopeptidase MepM/ murein hydrolase activator NlpD
MKLLLTEQQVKNLIEGIGKNLIQKQLNKAGVDLGGIEDIDIEKEAPHLAQAMKSFTNPGSLLKGDEKSGGIVSKAKNIFSNSKFAPNIPKGSEPMHPLGHKDPITSNFGYRNVSVGSINHQGVDIATPSGSPVYAPLDGLVISSRNTTPNACGGFIQLSHTDIKTKFCHLKQMVVKQGEKVKKGQLIGYTGGGKTDQMHGTSTGPHLHYEILGRGDIAMNPVTYQHNLA